MRPRVALFVAVLIGLAATASASTLLPLRPDAQSSAPELTVLDADARGVRIAFELPALDVDDYAVEGRAFQCPSFARAELMGEVGEPALPSFTRLVAVPAGVGATVRVLDVQEESFFGYQILPMQEDDTPNFAFDLATYGRDELLGGEPVTIGAPALVRELRVVPLTFRPVRCNPARGELRVMTRITVAVEFAGMDLRSAPARASIPVSRDLEEFYRSLVVNYDAGGRPESWPAANDLGCWLIICRDNADVLARIQPLVDWRARMGYKTVVATTTQTGPGSAQIQAWIQNAYNTWDEPPEYITLVGDVSGSFSLPTFYETYSGCGGEGDHSYTLLAGGDLYPDASIGRLSAESLDMLDLEVAKILGYEMTPRVNNPNWFSAACLIGDGSTSGITCIQVQQWLKEKLRSIGYTRLDTIFTPPFPSRITDSVNNGVTFCGYRGFYGTSGWNNSYIYNLNNGEMLPFAIMLTCGTGSFASGTSLNEAWFRGVPGSPYLVKGAIGAISTATTCTHTRFNNCFYVGAAYGLYWDGLYKLGRSQARGKVEMLLNYGDQGEYDYYNGAAYAWWNSLMGDPATELWTGLPATLTVDHPATVPLGSDQVTVHVGIGGLPRIGAWVYLYRAGEIGVGGVTDATGSVTLPIGGASAGTVLVTVTGHNLYPYRGSFAIAQQPRFVGVAGATIDDSAGNGDGAASPGETVRPMISLENFGTEPASGVTLSLAIDDPYVTVLSSGSIYYGAIAPGATLPAPDGFVLRLSPLTPPDHSIVMDLAIASSTDEWPARLALPLLAADLQCTTGGYELSGCGTTLDPGETAQLTVTFRNRGGLTARGPISVKLESESYAVRVSQPNGQIPMSIPPNLAGTTTAFGIHSPADCIAGSLAPLRLSCAFADGTRDTASFVLPVGTADEQDPTGPDAYGYYAYDNHDAGYPQHPNYAWININPYSGGPGLDVHLTDNGSGLDNTRTIPLPFVFRFYGRDFSEVSVCSNGFLGMGSTYTAEAQNWYLPSAMGPPYMIAPFWDDLHQSTTGRTFSWFDAANHRFVIAWDEVVSEATSNLETFEVILYDPAYYPTVTGDGEFVFQYETVANFDSGQMYSTVGIQNGDHTTGITFNYFNRRPATAAQLASGLAVKFTTGAPGASGVEPPAAPARFMLRECEPNPFHSGTTIRFSLPQSGPVQLRVFDAGGALVRTLYDGPLPAGEHRLVWTGADEQDLPAPAGVYFFRLDAGDRSGTRKVLRMR